MRWFLVAVIILLLAGCTPRVEEHRAFFESGYDTGYADSQKDLEEAIAESHEQGLKEGYDQALQEHDRMLKKPTYEEVIAFLEEDNSDRLLGNCLTRLEAVSNNAMGQGIWCQAVLFNYSTGSRCGFHAIVGFDTADKGMIYIEPLYDREVELVLGEDYTLQFCEEEDICPVHKMFVKQIGIIK